MTVEIPVGMTVTVTVKANIRQGTPSRSAPVVRKCVPGTGLTISAIAAGEDVQGNPLWYKLNDATYIWSGACGAAAMPGVPPAFSSASLPAESRPASVTGAPAANIIDLYHGDQVTSFAAARQAGVLGIIHKASTGGTGSDDAYHRRRQAALDAGLLWGAYHWGTAAPASTQVDNFLRCAEPDDRTLVALDFERDVGNQMTLAGARDFLEVLSQRLGRRAVIYSGSTIKNALGDSNDAFLGAHRLWLAQYGPSPHTQASWVKPWLWQFTDGKASDPRRRSVPGIPGNASGQLDANFYAGTAEQLALDWAS